MPPGGTVITKVSDMPEPVAPLIKVNPDANFLTPVVN